MASTYITMTIDHADAGNTSRQLTNAQIFARWIGREAMQKAFQSGPLQPVYVICGTQQVQAANANASYTPSSHAGITVAQF